MRPIVKVSAIPAQGIGRDDAAIGSIAVFLQKLPERTADQYARITAGTAAAPQEPATNTRENSDE